MLKSAAVAHVCGKKHVHAHKESIEILNCGSRLLVGVDIKFTPLVNSLDGRSGVAEVHEVKPNSPAEKAGIRVGQRILSLFGTVAHTKDEFFAIFSKKRVELASKPEESRDDSVNLVIETPCQIATEEADRAAEKYIRENIHSPTLFTAGFSCRCTICKSTSRSLCRNLPLMKRIQERKRQKSRRHSITDQRSKVRPSGKSNRRYKSNKKFQDFLKQRSPTASHRDKQDDSKSWESAEVACSSGSGSRASSHSPVTLKPISSFTELVAQRCRRATVS